MMALDEFLGKRTSFHFSPTACQHLDELLYRTRFRSYTDFLSVALDILAEMIDVVAAGGRIFIKAKKSNKIWVYSPYSPPRDYPHFPGGGDECDGDGKSQRRSFSFDPDMMKRVRQIRRASRFQSLSDVVRAAIAVVRELIAVQDAQDQIILQRKGSAPRPYYVLGGGEETRRDYRRPADHRPTLIGRRSGTAAAIETKSAEVIMPRRMRK